MSTTTFPTLEALRLCVDTPGGRPLIRDLHLRLFQEKVALIGRNGVGKTSLNESVCRRRQRKKNVGRLRELARATPRARLNKKRAYAQESQARVAKVREDRMREVRSRTKASRRALAVELPLDVQVPALPPEGREPLIVVEGAGVTLAGRSLFSDLSLRMGRIRVAVTGPNGAGKTTLIRVMLGELAPDEGVVWAKHEALGVITQGAANWTLEESLLMHLSRTADASPSLLMSTLLSHRFPSALATRPFATLSPGERVRAALLCLFQRSPPVELLILDEPADGLDFAGDAALRRVLAAWQGGLVVVSHDEDFLEEVGFDRRVRLGGSTGSEGASRSHPGTCSS